MRSAPVEDKALWLRDAGAVRVLRSAQLVWLHKASMRGNATLLQAERVGPVVAASAAP